MIDRNQNIGSEKPCSKGCCENAAKKSFFLFNMNFFESTKRNSLTTFETFKFFQAVSLVNRNFWFEPTNQLSDQSLKSILRNYVALVFFLEAVEASRYEIPVSHWIFTGKWRWSNYSIVILNENSMKAFSERIIWLIHEIWFKFTDL